MANPIITINLGADAKVDIEIIPSYKMIIKIAPVIFFKHGQSYLSFIIAYYTNGIKIQPFLTQYGGRIYIGNEDTEKNHKQHTSSEMSRINRQKIWHLKKFIKYFKENKSIKSRHWINECAWLPKINIWRAGYVKPSGEYVYNVCKFQLCDDSKEQFIKELQGLLHVFNNIHIKNIHLHRAIRDINRIDYTYHQTEE